VPNFGSYSPVSDTEGNINLLSYCGLLALSMKSVVDNVEIALSRTTNMQKEINYIREELGI
jgi:hypothetical protein